MSNEQKNKNLLFLNEKKVNYLKIKSSLILILVLSTSLSLIKLMLKIVFSSRGFPSSVLTLKID